MLMMRMMLMRAHLISWVADANGDKNGNNFGDALDDADGDNE